MFSFGCFLGICFAVAISEAIHFLFKQFPLKI